MTEPGGTNGLVFVDEDLIHIGESYSWLDLKRFRVSADSSDPAILADLIRHPQYADTYLEQDRAQDRHGPYWLAFITPERFELLEGEAAVAEVEAWALTQLDRHALGQRLQDELDTRVIGVLRSAASVYALRDVRPEGQHDYGFIPGSVGGFHEYVAIDRNQRELLLLVASDD